VEVNKIKIRCLRYFMQISDFDDEKIKGSLRITSG
jgi:hypothetical protein